MTIDQLECFLKVAQCGKFTEAAEKMYISHSAVSKTISTLESSLGVKLLERNNRSVKLTPAGEYLLERGGHLYGLWKDLETNLSRLGKEMYGKISVALPFLDTSTYFNSLAYMINEHPLVTVNVFPEEPPLSIFKSVKEGHFDLGITYSFGINDDLGRVQKILLDKDVFVAVVSEQHEFAGRESVTMEEISNYPMIFPPANTNEKTSAQLKDVQRTFTSDDYMGRNLMDCLIQASLGKGVLIIPSKVVNLYHLPLKTIPISTVNEPIDLVLIWREDKCTPVLMEMINYIKDSKEFESGRTKNEEI